MAYSINKTDGTILATVPDGQIDQLSSDITLIGKNYSGFGEALNENFVKLLENFADSTRPTKPVRGQIWFDTTESKLKVYTGVAFVPVSSATISKTQPLTLGVGDLWFNDVDRQLYFFDGTIPILLAPAFSQSQGKSGLEVQTVLDKNNISRVITLLFTGGSLLGIFAKDQFIPKNPIPGYSEIGEDKLIFPGFNAGTLTGVQFNVTSANSERLNNVPAVNFARRDQINIFDSDLIVRNDNGIKFGASDQGVLDSELGNIRISNIIPNRNIELNVRRGSERDQAINIVSATREVRIYAGQIESSTTVGGNLIVDGNLTVSGSTTTINTEVITLEDKNIELAKIPTPTDAFASGGGLIIKGEQDKRWIYVHDNPLDFGQGIAARSWNTSENINIAVGKAYKINGVDILTEQQCLVPSFPNVNQLGTQLSVTVGSDQSGTTAINQLRLQNSRITTFNSLDLELAPGGNIRVFGSKKIYGISTTDENSPNQLTQRTNTFNPGELNEIPSLSSVELSEAATKRYMLNFVRRRSIVLSLDISDAPSNSAIALLLARIAPPEEYENGTIARLLCTSLSNSPSTINVNSALNKNKDVEYITADEFGQPSGTNFPLQDVTVNPVTAPSQAITPTRTIRTYLLTAGFWDFQGVENV